MTVCRCSVWPAAMPPSTPTPEKSAGLKAWVDGGGMFTGMLVGMASVWNPFTGGGGGAASCFSVSCFFCCWTCRVTSTCRTSSTFSPACSVAYTAALISVMCRKIDRNPVFQLPACPLWGRDSIRLSNTASSWRYRCHQ